MNLGINACFYQRKSTGQGILKESRYATLAFWVYIFKNLRFNKDVSIDIDILNTRQHAFVSVLSRVVSVELGISSVKFTCY